MLIYCRSIDLTLVLVKAQITFNSPCICPRMQSASKVANNYIDSTAAGSKIPGMLTLPSSGAVFEISEAICVCSNKEFRSSWQLFGVYLGAGSRVCQFKQQVFAEDRIPCDRYH